MSDPFEDLLREVARAPEVDPASIARDEDLAGRTLGRFRVTARLGRGGMGSVYRAYDERLARDVALKVLRGGADDAALIDEARAAAAVRHRAIASIHDVGEVDGRAFLAMELVEGETLRARLARSGPTPEDATRIARALAGALARAHATGLVHLDVKPDNVMIDRDGEVKLLDFGLARRARGRRDRDRGVVRGTPGYMAPEQAAGGDVGPAADVFAIGVTWREIAGELPSAIAPIVARCLAEDPARRFADGAALADAIDAALRDAQKKRRIVRGAIVLATLAVVGAGAFVAARRARPHLAPTTALRRLTANVPEVAIQHAALSPDGESLAYVDRAGLHVARLGAPDARDVPLGDHGAPLFVAWEPDARSLDVATATEGGPGAIVRVPLDGGAARAIASGAFTGLARSHDGSRLAVAEMRRVAWIDAGGAKHPLVEKGAGCSITELAWSPDDARLAYATLCFGTLGDATIESVPADGGAPERIVADPRLFSDAARAGLLWSPRGDVVYPLAEWLPAESGANLWSVAVDARTGQPTSAPKPITSWVGTNAIVLSEDARGDRVAFVRADYQSDVYVGDLDASGMRLTTPRRLTMTDRNERPSTWSADSRGVYFFSDRTGSFDVFFQPIDAPAARAIATEPAWETMPQVAPDGRALLYWRFPPARAGEPVRPDIVRRSIDPDARDEAPIVVATAVGVSHPAGVGRPQPWEMRFRCPRAASMPCVLSEREGDVLVFRELDPIAGRGREIARTSEAPGANVWGLSHDGARLAIPRADGRVRVHAIASGADTDVSVAPGCDALAASWSAAGDVLFVTVECASEPAFRLYAKSLAGPLALLWSDAPSYVLETEASPDGRHLAIAVKSNDTDVWSFD